LLLAAYSIIRVSSVYYAQNANHVENIDEAIPLYQTAIGLDSEDPNPHFYLGNRMIAAGRYAEAAKHLNLAIQLGQGGSPTYSLLATAQFLSGNTGAAESTFSEAVKLYPRSTFVLSRYAFFLKLNGKMDAAATILERARTIHKPSSETWWTMSNDGAVKASKNASQNKELNEIMDLVPNAAIYAVKTEREIRFPEEKSFPLGVLQGSSLP
jgi:tetratricopeptide (TPR) repeat protein